MGVERTIIELNIAGVSQEKIKKLSDIMKQTPGVNVIVVGSAEGEHNTNVNPEIDKEKGEKQ